MQNKAESNKSLKQDIKAVLSSALIRYIDGHYKLDDLISECHHSTDIGQYRVYVDYECHGRLKADVRIEQLNKASHYEECLKLFDNTTIQPYTTWLGEGVDVRFLKFKGTLMHGVVQRLEQHPGKDGVNVVLYFPYTIPKQYLTRSKAKD